jgi:hypothetical protein
LFPEITQGLFSLFLPEEIYCTFNFLLFLLKRSVIEVFYILINYILSNLISEIKIIHAKV